MQKRKYKKFGAVILIVAMIVTMFSTESASADTGSDMGSKENAAIFQQPEALPYFLRSPHRYGYINQNGDTRVGYIPAMYYLEKKNGTDEENAAVYCCDLVTSIIDDETTDYLRTNLEDALKDDENFVNSGYQSYYTPQNAAKIRFVLTNGYYPGRDLADLARKAGLTEADGMLTIGEALSATQYAVWNYSNTDNVELSSVYVYSLYLDDERMEGVKSDLINSENNALIGEDGKNGQMQEAVKKRIEAVYNYLTGDANQGTENQSVIINFTDQHTVLMVANIDKDGTPSYDVTVKFKLKGTFSDNGNLNLTATLGDQKITCPLLGESSEKLSADSDGYYTITFKDIEEACMTVNPSIGLTIDGYQEVEDGIYFYEPINPKTKKVDRSYAQCFVGTGSGRTPIHSETTINFKVGTQTLKLQKVDGSVTEINNDGEGTNPPLSGVEFALYVKYGDLKEPVPYPGLKNKKTDENGEITWEGLVTGDGISYYYKEIAPKSGYEVITGMEDTDEQGEMTVLSNCHDLGSLTISKTAENFSDESPNKDRHYEFLVELDYSKAYLASNNHEWTSAEALEEQYAVLRADYENSCESVTLVKDETTGKMIVKVLLKAGESITLSGIPAGAEYTVTELNADGKPMGDYMMNEFDGELIATEYAVHKGVIPSDTIKDGETVDGSAEEEFVNVRFYEGVLDLDTNARFSIDIHKTLDGKPSTRAFSFTLTDVTNGGNKVLQTVKNATEGDEAGNVVFAPIKFKEAGTYTFEIREVLEKGYICDDNVYTVVVKVVRNDNNYCLEIDDVKYYSQDKKAEDIAALEKAAEDEAKETGSEPAEIELTGEEGLLEKGESIVFNNTTITYGNYTSVGVKKVWELNGTGTASDSVTVNLLKNGKVDKTVVLNQGNNWSYTWSLLDDSYTWTVSEADVPEGFTSTITKDGLTFTITNTYVEEGKTDEEEGGGGNGGNGNGGGNSGDDKNPNRLPPDWNVLDEAPKTGDAGADALVLNILLLSISALAGTILYLRRKKTNR